MYPPLQISKNSYISNSTDEIRDIPNFPVRVEELMVENQSHPSTRVEK